MANAIWFDVEIIDADSYNLYVMGDNKYLYYATVTVPSINPLTQNINFSKIDLTKIQLVNEASIFETMGVNKGTIYA